MCPCYCLRGPQTRNLLLLNQILHQNRGFAKPFSLLSDGCLIRKFGVDHRFIKIQRPHLYVDKCAMVQSPDQHLCILLNLLCQSSLITLSLFNLTVLLQHRLVTPSFLHSLMTPSLLSLSHRLTILLLLIRPRIDWVSCLAVFVNSCSLVNKLSSFQCFVYSSQFSINGVTETWLSDQVFDREICPSQYTLYHPDRSLCGGGVLLAVDKSIPVLSSSNSPDIKVVSIVCSLRFPLTVCVIYIPPNVSEDYDLSLHCYLSNLSLNFTHLLILGDFNYPDIDWTRLHGSTSNSNSFCDLLFYYNLHQLIPSSTRRSGNILDLLPTFPSVNLSAFQTLTILSSLSLCLLN